MSKIQQESPRQEAILAWVSLFEKIEPPLDFESLGSAHSLSRLLHESEPERFMVLPPVTNTDIDLEIHYLESLVHAMADWIQDNLTAIRVPFTELSLQKIASKEPGFTNDLVQLCQYLLLISVRSERNPTMIQKLQALKAKHRELLMELIEEKMIRLTEEEQLEKEILLPESTTHSTSQQKLEEENQVLSQQVHQLLKKVDELQFKNTELHEVVALSHKKLSMDTGQDALKAQLHDTERKLEDNLKKYESQTEKLKEMSKKESELESLRYQVLELQSMAENAQKTEMLLANYKKKVETAVDYKKKFKASQENVYSLQFRISELQEQVRQHLVVTNMIDSYKDRIVALETKNCSLSVELETIKDSRSQVDSELKKVKEEKTQDMERMNEMAEKLRHFELDAVIGHSEVPDETIDTWNQEDLHSKLSELSLEVESLKAEKRDLSDKLLSSENRIDDVERLKTAFEQDYRRTHELLLKSQAEATLLQDKVSQLSNTSQIQSQFHENERLLAEALSVNQEQSERLEAYKSQVHDAQMHFQAQVAQVNRLLQEKESKSNQMSQLSLKISELEKIIVDLKARNAALAERGGSNPDDLTIKLGSATEKLVQLTEQNGQLHTALRKARDHILLQDRMLREARAKEPVAPPYQEAIQSFETQVREKDQEIERLDQELLFFKAAKDEHSPIPASWYDKGRRSMSSTAQDTWLKRQRDRL